MNERKPPKRVMPSKWNSAPFNAMWRIEWASFKEGMSCKIVTVADGSTIADRIDNVSGPQQQKLIEAAPAMAQALTLILINARTALEYSEPERTDAMAAARLRNIMSWPGIKDALKLVDYVDGES